MNDGKFVNNCLVNILRQLMKQQGVTQYRLSVLAGIPLSTLSNKLRCKQSLNVRDFFVICDALGLSASEVMRQVHLLADEADRTRYKAVVGV